MNRVGLSGKQYPRVFSYRKNGVAELSHSADRHHESQCTVCTKQSNPNINGPRKVRVVMPQLRTKWQMYPSVTLKLQLVQEWAEIIYTNLFH